MKKFNLEIVTPREKPFAGEVEKLFVPTTEGPVCIMAGHIDFFAKLVAGKVRIVSDGAERSAECDGGVLSVRGGRVSMAATDFGWE